MSWDGPQIIQVIEHTTRNARKIKWYTLLYGDTTTKALTFDPNNGSYYLDGVRVEDPNEVEYIKLSIIQSQPLKLPNPHKYRAPSNGSS